MLYINYRSHHTIGFKDDFQRFLPYLACDFDGLNILEMKEALYEFDYNWLSGLKEMFNIVKI